MAARRHEFRIIYCRIEELGGDVTAFTKPSKLRFELLSSDLRVRAPE